MIIVIADDLTGAAELGGLGLRYGLTVEIVTTAHLKSAADLLIIAMDTRSMPIDEALEAMGNLTALINQTKPGLIYKKVDSVLRGHLIAELNIHLHHLRLKRALLVPANPAFGRTITKGNYFIHGEPIHLSSFADDPEFAITSSDVRAMLRVNEADMHIHNSDQDLPDSGIILGECLSESDLTSWANKADKYSLLAGGSGFFAAILESLGLQPLIETRTMFAEFKQPALFICGSTFNKSKQLVEKVSSANGPVSYMPLDIVTLSNPSESLFDQWADAIVSLLKNNYKAIIAVDENTTANIEIIPGSLREKKARVVEKVIGEIDVKELLVEGGATAAAIISRLGINRFFPVTEFDTGVIRMKVDKFDDLFLTLKPGSYDWPSHIWNF